MGSKPWSVTRLCLRNLTGVSLVVLVVVAVVTIPSVIQVVQAGPDEYFEKSYLPSSGNAWYAVVLIAPAAVAWGHLPKVMHLNASKDTFLVGAVLLHALLAGAVSAVNLAFFSTLDRSWAQTFQVVNLAQTVGWTGNGLLVSFVQQSAFLLLVALVAHWLTSIHRSSVGWLVDLGLVTLLGLSLAIEPLASGRTLVTDLLVTHESAVVQVTSCLVAAAMMCWVNLAVLRRQEL